MTVRSIVVESMVAALEVSKIHNVLSTSRLVYYSEIAARKLIEPYVDRDGETANSEVSLRHISGTKIGDEVEVTALLEEIMGKGIICESSASNPASMIHAWNQSQSLMAAGELNSWGK